MKLFWFKSSSVNTEKNKTSHSSPNDNKVRTEENQPSGIRRSRSLSSARLRSGGLDESNNFFSCEAIAFANSSNNIPLNSSDFPVCNRSLNPERQHFDDSKSFGSPCSSKVDSDSSENSSCNSQFPHNCESPRFDHASNSVLDLYIDGEQKNARNLRVKVRSSPIKPSGNCSGRRPPRVQSTAPSTPTGSFTEKCGSHSVKDFRDSSFHVRSRDAPVNEFGHESPQKLAKNVVKRLSQVSPYKSKTPHRDADFGSPTTVEDIFENCMEPCRGSTSDVPESVYSLEIEEGIDLELHRKAKHAADRVVQLSKELESESFLKNNGYSIQSLLQIIGNFIKERRNLAAEVSEQLQYRIADRNSAKEALRLAKVELDSQTLRLEKEKREMQSGLEKELDRRSNDWSFKVQSFQVEEQRLRARVRELAEQNVSLQREVSFLHGRDGENLSRITNSEQSLKDLRTSLEEVEKENNDLKQCLSDLQDQFRSAESDRESIHRSYKEKERENKELHKAITRLQRTCSEQEKTISGLRQGLSDDVEKKQSSGNFDSHTGKLQMEQLRLTGVEQTLRREAESFRLEVESLRRENITLLDRLRCSGDVSGSSCFRLDQELLSRVDCLQNQGLSLFAQSNQLCEKLVEVIKAKEGQNCEMGNEHGQEVNKNGSDGYFLLESDMKIQSLKLGLENLKRSLRTITSVLHKKSDSVTSKSLSEKMEFVDSGKHHCQTLEDNTVSELKAEVLLTTALRDKLFAKQLEVDQLQLELATAIRGHDILRSEVQATQDAVSSISHSIKDLELQMLRKDESINRLETDLQDCSKELSLMNGILPKISKERDLLWEEVKQYTESNMLLNLELNTLRKKVEFLDEDVLVKEGQISILKDTLDNKTYDILSSPKSFQEFRLE